jgi:hypothetical protein
MVSLGENSKVGYVISIEVSFDGVSKVVQFKVFKLGF